MKLLTFTHNTWNENNDSRNEIATTIRFRNEQFVPGPNIKLKELANWKLESFAERSETEDTEERYA